MEKKNVLLEETNVGQTLLSITPPLLNLFHPETVPFILAFYMLLPFKKCQQKVRMAPWTSAHENPRPPSICSD